MITMMIVSNSEDWPVSIGNHLTLKYVYDPEYSQCKPGPRNDVCAEQYYNIA